jgi:hypothetical protein
MFSNSTHLYAQCNCKWLYCFGPITAIFCKILAFLICQTVVDNWAKMVGAELVSGPSWSVGWVGQWAELTSFRCIDCIPWKCMCQHLFCFWGLETHVWKCLNTRVNFSIFCANDFSKSCKAAPKPASRELTRKICGFREFQKFYWILNFWNLAFHFFQITISSILQCVYSKWAHLENTNQSHCRTKRKI